MKASSTRDRADPARDAGPVATSAPSRCAADTLLGLQRQSGNRTVGRLLAARAAPPRVDPDRAGDRVGRALGSVARPREGAPEPAAHLHVDAPARDFARRLGVPAFTVGSHVFAAPDTPEHVLAHEAAHVRQARREPTVAATLHPVRRRAAETEARAHEQGAAGAIREGGLVHYYGEAGHFYTVYLVALAVGFDDVTAFRIAFYAQMPDEAHELDATAVALDAAQAVVLNWGVERAVADRDAVQRGGHSLTGRPSAEEQARRRAMVSALSPQLQEFGYATHALGDAYAHSTIGNPGMMYQPNAGHAAQLSGPHDPDHISLRPLLYHEYVRALYRSFTAAAAAYPDPARPVATAAQNERILNDVAWEIGYLPEDGQIAALRQAAARFGRTMDTYAPELVDAQAFAEFRTDPSRGGPASAMATAAAQDSSLDRARGFMAWQASAVPAPLVPQVGPLNPGGFFFDVGQAAIGDAVQHYNEMVLQLEAEARQFFAWQYGYGLL